MCARHVDYRSSCIARTLLRLGMVSVGLSLVMATPAWAQDAEEERVLAVAEAALIAITNEDLVALTDLMVDEALTFVALDGGGGGVPYSVRPRAESRARTINADIVERGFDGEVRISGPLATVWLPYDLYRDGEWSHCGVDVFTMIRVEGQWRIATLAYTIEQPPACRRHPDGPPGN